MEARTLTRLKPLKARSQSNWERLPTEVVFGRPRGSGRTRLESQHAREAPTTNFAVARVARRTLPEGVEAGRTSLRRKNSDGNERKQQKEGHEGRRVEEGCDLWRAGQASNATWSSSWRPGRDSGFRVQNMPERPSLRRRSRWDAERSATRRFHAAQGIGKRTEVRFGGRPGVNRDPKAATVHDVFRAPLRCARRAFGPFLESRSRTRTAVESYETTASQAPTSYGPSFGGWANDGATTGNRNWPSTPCQWTCCQRTTPRGAGGPRGTVGCVRGTNL
jgi:hypothetical protein